MLTDISFWVNLTIMAAVLALGWYLWGKTTPLVRGNNTTALLLRAGRQPLLSLLLLWAAWQTSNILYDIPGVSYPYELLSAFFPFAATAILSWVLMRLVTYFYQHRSANADAEHISHSVITAFWRVMQWIFTAITSIIAFISIVTLINKLLEILSRHYPSLNYAKISYTLVLDWLSNNLWLANLIFFLVATLIFFCLWVATRKFLMGRAQSTKTQWDNVILHALDLPLVTFIIIFGFYNIGNSVFVFWSESHPGIAKFLDTISSFALVGIIFWILLRLISGIERVYRKKTITVGDKSIDSGSVYAIFRVIRAIILIIAVLTIMNSLGVSISGILAFGGVGGVVIGFATKDTLTNFFSSLLIFWERPFVVGDWVKIPDINVEGVVENIGWRMTQIRTFDRRPLYVPNSLFSNSVIENPQRMTNRRIYEYLGVRYDDIEQLPILLEDIRHMLQHHDDISLKDIIMVNFDRYGASSLDFFIYAMTKTTVWTDYHEVKEDVLFRIAELVKKHKCEFAFPTRTLHHLHANAPQSPITTMHTDGE